MKRQVTAFALATAFAAALVSPPALGAGAQGEGSITGKADREAKKPYPQYSVRARDVRQGTIAATVPLAPDATFALSGVTPANYLVELLDPKGKVVCTEGPFDLTRQANRDNVKIECGKPAAWWLLAAAGAAGITAGVVSGDTASASR